MSNIRSEEYFSNPMYKKLPPHVFSHNLKKDLSDSKQAAKDFLKKFVADDNEDVNVALRAGIKLKANAKYYTKTEKKEFLHPQQKKERHQHKSLTKGGLSGQKKRKMGLCYVKRKDKKYADFIQFHKLWLQYATRVLGIDHYLSSGWTGEVNDGRTLSVQNKLKKIEYFGSKLNVVSSKCFSYVDISGIVIKETKNTFSIITENDSVKTIPKLHSEFQFEVSSVKFNILGSHLHQRPVERARHALKKHNLYL